jgi:hypothetical protein
MILVTGATGAIGRVLIDLLSSEGADIRAVTRDPRAAGLPAHVEVVEVVEGDPARPDTIAPSLQGVTGDAIGRPLRYQEVRPEAAKRGMVEHGIPEPFAQALLSRQANGNGQPAFVSGEVEKILGRPALTFAEWAADHAADFRH